MPGAEPFSHDGSDVGVLLCHGFTGTPQGLRGWAEFLVARGYTVRLPRLPGHGTTWQDLNRYSFEDWYATVDLAFRELTQRCRKVVVCGLSMGGALALMLAQNHGPHVAGLVLVNPAVKFEDPRLAVLPVLKHLVGSLRAVSGDIKKPGTVELAYSRSPLKAGHSQVRAWGPIIRDLPEITQPLLLVRSVEDHIIPASSAALVLSRISSTDVTEIVVEDSYHVIPLDNDAQRLFEESLVFIERVTA
ncbi:MAG TPA: alpha/beta fold hydrolase [Dermatophilaceae bacterium]|nr:alpha/beta fold hydrolase [Dermatophilaceae bacterium]